MEKIYTMLGQRWAIILLLIINIPGTIYGYMWYESQLANTPPIFLLFVPDSPTASLFFVIVLIAFLLKKNLPLFEALAAVTLFKYGVWAVVMIVWPAVLGAELRWDHYMLIASHLGMAVQGLLYAPFYRIKPWHLILVAVWTLHNDVIDYIYGMHPYVSRLILPHYEQIAYFTFWLSVLSLLIVYVMNKQKKRTLGF
ncbi:DUF1405 domain-containing protein [Alteribacter aurantiacus]|uniref:DUF1405 domain-containing protein n=1 Tax=Alteribacter aurantiacus TaxID=254410 RepID=UPI000406DC0D|nr:DUF1405 domain-containing protein [Alteribacter aurantiacus]